MNANVSDLAVTLRESVVEVRSGEAGCGAGLIWGGAGLIVTNAHCVAHPRNLRVDNGIEQQRARLLALHHEHDLALLSVSAVRGPLLEQRPAETLRTGELVFALGHPNGVRHALAMGVPASVTRTGDSPRWIVTDVKLAPGNSGGPLVDCEGRLVGINSMIVTGMGVAIPALLVQRFVEQALARRAA
jgi:serine protease Do